MLYQKQYIAKCMIHMHFLSVSLFVSLSVIVSVSGSVIHTHAYTHIELLYLLHMPSAKKILPNFTFCHVCSKKYKSCFIFKILNCILMLIFSFQTA